MIRSNLKSSTLRKVGALGAFLGLGLIASEASADILRVVTNTNSRTENGPATVVLTNFTTSVANQHVVITFNAECTISGGPVNWLGTDIIVDPAGTPGPVTIPPSTDDNALCSGNGTATWADGFVSAVTQATTLVPTAGVHTLTVNMVPNPGGTDWYIDDLSLIVENE